MILDVHSEMLPQTLRYPAMLIPAEISWGIQEHLQSKNLIAYMNR